MFYSNTQNNTNQRTRPRATTKGLLGHFFGAFDYSKTEASILIQLCSPENKASYLQVGQRYLECFTAGMFYCKELQLEDLDAKRFLMREEFLPLLSDAYWGFQSYLELSDSSDPLCATSALSAMRAKLFMLLCTFMLQDESRYNANLIDFRILFTQAGQKLGMDVAVMHVMQLVEKISLPQTLELACYELMMDAISRQQSQEVLSAELCETVKTRVQELKSALGLSTRRGCCRRFC